MRKEPATFQPAIAIGIGMALLYPCGPQGEASQLGPHNSAWFALFGIHLGLSSTWPPRSPNRVEFGGSVQHFPFLFFLFFFPRREAMCHQQPRTELLVLALGREQDLLEVRGGQREMEMFVALCCQLLVPPILGQKHLLRDDHQVRSNAARRSAPPGVLIHTWRRVNATGMRADSLQKFRLMCRMMAPRRFST